MAIVSRPGTVSRASSSISALTGMVVRLIRLVSVGAGAAPRERVDRRPHVSVVLGDLLVAHRDLGRVGGEGPVLGRPDAEGDLAVAAGAVEPQHLGVAALDRLQPTEIRGLAF